MKTKMTILFYIIAVLVRSANACEYFEMQMSSESAYTPGSIELKLKLTPKARLEGVYNFYISIYVGDDLVKRSHIKMKDKEDTLEFSFPEVRSRTEGKYRAELFIDDTFIGAEEKPFVLWPGSETFNKKLSVNRKIWTFDTSGRLKEIFERMGVKTNDALFQSVRSFDEPNIIFIGELTEPNDIKIIDERIKTITKPIVVVYLNQKFLPSQSPIRISDIETEFDRVDCEIKSGFFEGLNKHDIEIMIRGNRSLQYKSAHGGKIRYDSLITEKRSDSKHLYSYFLETEENDRHTLYCQLNLTGKDDPRGIIILKNLLKYAINH